MNNSLVSTGYMWARHVLDYCQEIGVKTICIAPGSRSTCLVKAASDSKSFKIATHYDERSLGFFALGCAKYKKEPVVVITTSGSAVANLVPSATEASVLKIPIIYITADRPSELHFCGANQTLHQEPLLQPWVSHQLSVDVNDDNDAFQSFSKQVNYIFSHIKGPIHINMAFREPFLTPQSEVTTLIQPDIKKIPTNKSTNKTLKETYKDYKDLINNHNVICILSTTIKAIDAKKIHAWSVNHNIPIFAECSSTLALNEPVIRQVDSVLQQLDSMNSLPAFIICVGSRWISKSIHNLLKNQANGILIHDFSTTQNWLHMTCKEICDSENDLVEILPKYTANKSYYDRCIAISKKISDEPLSRSAKKIDSETKAIKALLPLINHMDTIFLGNSLTVRAVNTALPRGNHSCKIFTQRGVSGIDGLISTTAGLAEQEKNRSMGIIGDLSFFYDVNGLSLLAYSKKPVLLVVLNNSGGQIFNNLPIKDDSICESLFVLPQNIDIEQIAKAYSLEYEKVTSSQDIDELKNKILNYSKSCIIECLIQVN